MLSASDFIHIARLLLATYVLEDSSASVNIEDVVGASPSSSGGLPPARKKAKLSNISDSASDEGYVSRNSFVIEEDSSSQNLSLS